MVERNLKVIFYLLTSQIFDFGDVEKATFQVDARHWKLIFFLLTSSKCDLGEVETEMFQELACYFENILGPFDHPKMRLGWVRKSYVSRARMALLKYFRPLDQH